MALFFKNLLFTVLVPGTVAVYVPFWLMQGRGAANGSLPLVAAVVLLVGMSIYGWTVWDFASFGRGTPAPIDAPKRLVVRGLYRYTRNPMYVGVLTVIIGWSLYFGAPVLIAYAAAVWSMFHLFVSLYEERALADEFGSEYEAYCARVGRWLPRRARDVAPR